MEPSVQHPPLYDYDDYGEPPEPRISFSLDEMLHLALSVIVLSLAFAFALGGAGLLAGVSSDLNLLGQDPCAIEDCIARAWKVFPWSIAIVVTAFVLHELAHKIAAQRMHMWAEFRSSLVGLAVGLAVSVGLGAVVAAPGAVLIFGRASDRDAGVISIVGPIVNIAIAGLAMALYAVAPGLDPSVGPVGSLFGLAAFINLMLATFNMLPVPPLDGSKVWRWSKLGYAATVAVIAVMFWAHLASPASILTPSLRS